MVPKASACRKPVGAQSGWSTFLATRSAWWTSTDGFDLDGWFLLFSSNSVVSQTLAQVLEQNSDFMLPS